MIKAIETQYKGYKFRSRLEARWAVFFDAIGFDWVYEPEGFELSDGTRYLPDFLISSHPTWSVPTFRLWLEVKPRWPTQSELKKILLLKYGLHEKNGGGNRMLIQAGVICGTPGFVQLGTDDNGGWTLNDGYVILTPNATRPTGAHHDGVRSVKAITTRELAIQKSTQKENLLVEMQTFAMTGGGSVLDLWPLYIAESSSDLEEGDPLFDLVKKVKDSRNFLSPIYPGGAIPRIYTGPGVFYDSMPLRLAYTAARSARFEHGETPRV